MLTHTDEHCPCFSGGYGLEHCICVPKPSADDRPTGDDAILDGQDVYIKPIERDACECGEPATHAVWLDLRPIGVSRVVVETCEACAQHYAAQLRGGMR